MKKLLIETKFFLGLLFAFVITTNSYGQGFTETSITTGTNSPSPITVHGPTSGAVPVLGDGIYIGIGKWQAGNGLRNTAVGVGALANTNPLPAPGGYNNTAFGYNALLSTINGRSNVAVGTSALANATASDNTAVGALALSAANNTAGSNTAIGAGAMAATTTGGANTVVGFNCLSANIGGADNVVIGASAMAASTSGSQNCVVGFGSLQSSLTTSYNTAYGFKSLNKLTGSGTATPNDTYNTAVGYGAMWNLTTGFINAGLGHGILSSLIVGDSNTAVGGGALSTLHYGNNNVGIGCYAAVPGGNGTSGSPNDNKLSIQNVIYGINMSSATNGNVAVGTPPGAYPSLPALAKFEVGGTLKVDVVTATTLPITSLGGFTNNFLYVGTDGIVKQAPLPSSYITASCTQANYIPKVSATGSPNMGCSQIYDNGTSVGIGTAVNLTYTSTAGQWLNGAVGGVATPGSGPFKLSVEGVTRSLAYFAYSDKRLKKNINPIRNSLTVIKKLTGVTYLWDKTNEKSKDFTDMPQVGFIAQEVADVVGEAVVKDGDGYYSMNYSAIIPILNEGIKEQQTQIESQQVEIENLKTTVAELKNKLNQLTPGDVKIKVNSIEVVPNPITGISVVSYKLDNASANAYLIISDLQGKLLKQISLAKNQQQGQVQVNKQDLPAGMYVFAIVSGNTEVQSKKVLVSE